MYWSLFWSSLLCVLSSFAIILTRKRELVALLLLSFGCLVTVNVLWLFLTMPWAGLQCVIVIFPDHNHYFSSLELLLLYKDILTDPYLAYLLYSPGIPPLIRASTWELFLPFLTLLVWCGPDSNPRPPVPRDFAINGIFFGLPISKKGVNKSFFFISRAKFAWVLRRTVRLIEAFFRLHVPTQLTDRKIII